MDVKVLASGSKANTTLVRCDEFNMLIDCGLSVKKMQSELKKLELTTDDIDIVLITHAHSDHCKSVDHFDSEIVYKGYEFESLDKISELLEGTGIEAVCFNLSHDSKCVGYQVKYEGETYTHVSDTGYVDENLFELISESDYLFIEFNHDVDMLLETDRPKEKINRVLSDLGHLNNKDAAKVVCRCDRKLKKLFVAHISSAANSITLINSMIKLVYAVYEKEIKFEIVMTSQDRMV